MKLIRRSRSFVWLVLIVCFWAGAVRAQDAAALTGVYNGRYTCAQGPTDLKLSVVVSPIGDISALFTFYLPAAAPTQGYTYSLHGDYEPRTARFSLAPVRWETEHPANFGMVGMNGVFEGDELSGSIIGMGCGAFNVSRDKGESANIAAVIAAQKNGGKPLTLASRTAHQAVRANSQSRTQSSGPAPAPNRAAAPQLASAQDAYMAALRAQAPASARAALGGAPAQPAAAPQSQPTAAASARKGLYVCYTEKPGASVVYYTDIFELSYTDDEAENIIQVAVVEDDFSLHLTEQVGYDPVRSKEDTGIRCKFLVDAEKVGAMAAAATQKKSLESASAASKQKVIETGWKYIEEAEPSTASSAPPVRPAGQSSVQQTTPQRAAATSGAKAGPGVAGNARTAKRTNTPSSAKQQADIKHALDDFDKLDREMTNPVLKWELSRMKDPRVGGSSLHPVAHTFLNEQDTIDAAVSCNQKGMSVFFKTDSYNLDHPPAFVWYQDPIEKSWVSEVRVSADGRSHTAKGFPDEDQDKLYSNSLGIFFYRPDLAKQEAREQEFEVRSAFGYGAAGIDRLLRPLASRTINADLEDAAASSGGPVTDLLNAKSLRVDFSLDGWAEQPYLDINPQDPVLHKFVAECAAHLGLAPGAAKPASPARARSAPPANSSR